MKKKQPNWRSIDDFHILKNGNDFFPKLLDACKSAQESIHISLYWFESGHVANDFIEAFIEARRRNVTITLLLDQVGSLDLSKHDRARLIDAGVILGWYNPVKFERLHLIFQRDHSKLFIIDRDILFIGGTGIADIFSPKNHSHSWRENMFQVQGNIVADALNSLKRKWASSDAELERPTKRHKFRFWLNSLFAPLKHHTNVPAHGNATLNNGLWLESRGSSQRNILNEVIYRIKHSQQRIIFATAYFAPSPRLRYALKKAVQRGVDVTLLVPGKESDHPIFQRAGQYYYQGLLKKGVKIFEFQKSFMHTKLVVCDDFICLGSSNLDIYTQRWSLEANIAILDPAKATEVTAMLQDDISSSKAIEKNRWDHRGMGIRFLNYLAYSISRWGNNWARQLLLFNRYYKARKQG